jgi:hypothetical protein
MYSTPVGKIDPAVNGQLNLSYRDVEGWRRFFGVGKSLDILMGDDTAGPYILFSCFGPMEDEMPRGPAHGHDSDTWRMSVLGTTNVGNYAYTEGQFRFQDGSISYPGDNVAWGPRGGYGVLIFGDRRGWPARPVDKKHQEKAAAQQKPFSDKLGIQQEHPSPKGSTIASTLGQTSLGHLDSNLDSSKDWDEVSPGTRASISLMGDRIVGPVLVLLNGDPGARVVPAGNLGTETLHVVAEGSCTVDGVAKTLGDFWLSEAGSQPEVVAGPEGLSHVLLIGERQELPKFTVGGRDQHWIDTVAGVAAKLQTQL